MSTEPAVDAPRLIVPREMTAASDMYCLPAQREFQCKGCSCPGIAFHANFSSMLLNNAVSDRKPQPGSPVLAVFRSSLGGKEGIVDALNVLRSYPGARIGDAN